MKMKKYALVGLLGGMLFSISDLLVYLLPHYLSPGYYQDVADMNIWRLASSTYIGCIGSILLLIGFYSLYSITKENCSKLINKLMLIIIAGLLITPIGHFMVACIKPMTFKIALDAGVPFDMAKQVGLGWLKYTSPIKYVGMSIIIIFQSVMVAMLILKGKIKSPKWMALLNPFVMVLLSGVLLIFLNVTKYVGITETLESLGEGLIYIPVYYHWKKCN